MGEEVPSFFVFFPDVRNPSVSIAFLVVLCSVSLLKILRNNCAIGGIRAVPPPPQPASAPADGTHRPPPSLDAVAQHFATGLQQTFTHAAKMHKLALLWDRLAAGARASPKLKGTQSRGSANVLFPTMAHQ